jgi:hypothetical protein
VGIDPPVTFVHLPAERFFRLPRGHIREYTNIVDRHLEFLLD